MTTLEDVRAGWDAAAVQDAMGHILTTGDAWDPEEFYKSGRNEIASVWKRAEQHLGEKRRRALDFGCGVGRLTVALADHYDEVVGVDVSGEMLKRARAHEHVRYQHISGNLWEGTRLYRESFDLVYSMIVLQHMPQPIAHVYVREFIKLLTDDGLAIFEIPEGPDFTNQTACLSMWATPENVIRQLVDDAGAETLDVEQVCEAPPWRPLRYTVRRK